MSIALLLLSTFFGEFNRLVTVYNMVLDAQYSLQKISGLIFIYLFISYVKFYDNSKGINFS